MGFVERFAVIIVSLLGVKDAPLNDMGGVWTLTMATSKHGLNFAEGVPRL